MSLGTFLIAILVPLSVAASATQGGTVQYVNQQASERNDGTSWTDAFLDLHDALAVAQSGDEIWVAAGTYKPDRGTGDRLMSFQLVSGVGLYGGFAGFEECLDERNWFANPTILSGDLNGDDGPRDCAEASDCCREHQAPGCDDPECNELVCDSWPDCCMDGQQGTPAWDNYNCVGRARLACCHVGSWRSCENTHTILELDEGDETTTLDGFVVERAYLSYARDGQTSGSDGAIRPALGSLAISGLLVRNVVVRENAPRGIGGATVVVEDSEFTANLGVDWGGRDVVIRRTHVHDSGGMGAYSSAVIEDCLFERNSSYFSLWGGGAIRRSRFVSNWGPVLLNEGYFEVTDSTFLDGWGLSSYHSAALVERCQFIGNHGAGIYGGGSVGWIRNNLFVGNRAVRSPVSFTDSYLDIENCTFYGNGSYEDPVSYAITLYSEGSHADIRNCILRGHPDDVHAPEYYMLLIQSGATMDISHSIVEGWTGRWGGVGNSGVDPLFVDPDGADDLIGTEDDDLRLSPDSPAINAGDPSDVPSVGETDLDGHPRILCGDIDLGAYEFGIGDYDCNRMVDLTDFASWQTCMTGPEGVGIPAGCDSFDFNADGDVDLQDLYFLHRVFAGP